MAWTQKKILTLTALALFVVVAAGAAFVLLIMRGLMHTDVTEGAVRAANAHPEVARACGGALTPGAWLSGTMSSTKADGHADLAVPFTCGAREGTLYVVASKSAGLWTYERLDVAFDDAPDRIDARPTSAAPR